MLDTLYNFEFKISGFSKTSSPILFVTEAELNLMLKHFANKYAINENLKKLIHLECFYTFFLDSVYYQNVTSLNSFRRLYTINCQLLDFTTKMVTQLNCQSLSLETTSSTATNTVDVATVVNDETAAAATSTGAAASQTSNTLMLSPSKKNHQQIIGSFIKKTLSLPLKIVLLLSDFRGNFSVRYRLRRGGHLELVSGGGGGGGGPIDDLDASIGESAIDELREMVLLYRAVCELVRNLINVNPSNLRRLEQVEAKFAVKFDIEKPRFGYDVRIQFELIKQVNKIIVYLIKSSQIKIF